MRIAEPLVLVVADCCILGVFALILDRRSRPSVNRWMETHPWLAGLAAGLVAAGVQVGLFGWLAWPFALVVGLVVTGFMGRFASQWTRRH